MWVICTFSIVIDDKDKFDHLKQCQCITIARELGDLSNVGVCMVIHGTATAN